MKSYLCREKSKLEHKTAKRAEATDVLGSGPEVCRRLTGVCTEAPLLHPSEGAYPSFSA